MEENNKAYYKILHSAAQHFSTKLWAIPAVFFAILGLMWANIDFNNFFILKNFIILIFGILIIIFLLIEFCNDHFCFLSISKKISEYDNSRTENTETNNIKKIPLYSLTDKQICERMQEMKKNSKDEYNCDKFREFLIRSRVSGYFIYLIVMSVVMIVAIGLVALFSEIYERWQ
jgi:hypothetical protein